MKSTRRLPRRVLPLFAMIAIAPVTGAQILNDTARPAPAPEAFWIPVVGLLTVLIVVLIVGNLCRRRAERRLAESERTYRLLVEHQSEMVVQVDAEGRFLFASPRYCKTFGKTEDELLGRRFLPLVHPDDHASTEAAMRSLRAPPHECRVEQRAKTVEGWRWFAWADRAIVDEDGNVTSVIGVGQDITERKNTQDKLQSALEAKDALMKEMNHRIKNNLMMIISLIRLKARQPGDHSDLADIQRQIEAIRIVHEKLHESADVTSVVVEPYLRQLISTVFASFADRPVDWTVNAPRTSLPVKVATVVGLIVNELTTNAIQHGMAETGTMSFECTVTTDESVFTLLVSNTGKPFPLDVDLSQTTTLGMRIVTMLVDQLDGSLSLRREPSPEFTIRFPV